jgi:hypothetical protein
VAIAGVFAWSYIKYFAVPAYKSTATILVKDEKKGVEDSKTIEALNTVGSKKIVENEVEVISSRQLIKQVAINLNLYAPIYEEDNFRSVSAYTTSPVIIEVKDVENITSQKKVYFLFNESNGQVVIGKNAYALDQWVTTPFGVLKFRKNEKFVEDMNGDSKKNFNIVAVGKLTVGTKVSSGQVLAFLWIINS